MTDNISAMQRHRAMKSVKGKNTSPELIVRRLLRNLGHVGYRLHPATVNGKPDIAWIGRKLAIFVHGCFWHGHTCKRGARIPKTNKEYWERKIFRNIERDRNTIDELKQAGWKILIIWECELQDVEVLTETIEKFLGK